MVPLRSSLYLVSQIAVNNMSMFGTGYEATKSVIDEAEKAETSKLASICVNESDSVAVTE